MEGGTLSMTLDTIISGMSSLVTAMGTTFTTLAAAFGIFLFLPVLFRTTGKTIGYVKGILGFTSRRGRR